MKRSGYLQQRDGRTQALLDVMQRTMKQYMLDTLLITMHEDFGWGYDRLSRLAEKWARRMTFIFRRCKAPRSQTSTRRDLTGRRAAISGTTSFTRLQSAIRRSGS